MTTANAKRERGDFQTPDGLASQACEWLAARLPSPRCVIEPTCGQGAFVEAALRTVLPAPQVVGFDRRDDYLQAARARPNARRHSAAFQQADAFELNWAQALGGYPEPLWLLGNPPWVTVSTLGERGSQAAPARSSTHARGLQALTGASNFDVAEWLALTWWRALANRDAYIALLVKSSTARRVMAAGWAEGLPSGAAHFAPFDARAAFGVAVDAGLWVLPTRGDGPRRCWVHEPLERVSNEAIRPRTAWAWLDGALRSDADEYQRTRAWAVAAGADAPAWRSGIKHDCAAVLELTRGGDCWMNGSDLVVDVEADRLYPLVKCADLHRLGDSELGRQRRLLVPREDLRSDTAGLEQSHPRTWSYLQAHRSRLDARKSRVYANRPPFCLFGIGPYAFTPWKVAISGLHKSARFRLIGPVDGRPVVCDDTVYYLPFESETEARRACKALQTDEAAAFLAARTFWDAKRPITAKLLRQLDWRSLARQ